MICRRWTHEDLERLRQLWPCTPTSEIATLLGRSVGTLYVKASELKLRKDQRVAVASRARGARERHQADRDKEIAAAKQRAVAPELLPYRKAAMRAAREALIAEGVDEAQAALAVSVIAHGKVPRVRIEY